MIRHGPEKHPLLPSYVRFAENGRWIVGHEAKRLGNRTKNTVYDAKRIIGS